MNAAHLARQFTYLRTLQRLLKLYEVSHGDLYGVATLRQHVLDEMKRVAKLMYYSESHGS